MVRLDITVSGCDSDDQTDAVLLELRERLLGMDVMLTLSSGDGHLRTFHPADEYNPDIADALAEWQATRSRHV